MYIVLRDTVDLSSGRLPDGTIDHSLTDCLLTDTEHSQVVCKLDNMLVSVCDYCHERLGKLLSASPNDKDKIPNDKDKFTNDVSKEPKGLDKDLAWNDKSWLSERATTAQVCRLASMVEDFTETCEKLCGKQCTALRSAFKAQASKFVKRFHDERKTKITHILDSERWKQADVPAEIQMLVSFVYENKSFPNDPLKREFKDQEANVVNYVMVGDEKYAVVGAALILVQIVHEYCR